MEIQGKRGKETLQDCLANGGYRGLIYQHRKESDCFQYAGRIYKIERTNFKKGEEIAQIVFVDMDDLKTVEIRTSCLLNDRVFKKNASKSGNGRQP